MRRVWVCFRLAFVILWEVFRHPGKTSYIDLETGKVIRRT